jgi:hypothetical protein
VKQVNNITSVYEICSKTVEALFAGGVTPQTALIDGNPGLSRFLGG